MIFITSVIKTVLRQNRNLIYGRYCHTQNGSSITNCDANAGQTVRVRFAPSPTGYLHLGGLRTALYNYLFAKAHNGTFIVRIEDTDQSRVVPDATETLFNDLEWAGLIPDESVIHGGNFGPYIQSERLDIYRSEVKKLLENGSAYYCFCTERRLDLLRKDALRANQVPKYDNRCRHLTPVQVAEKLANSDSMCIRFKLESTVTKFDDIVYGNIEYDVAKFEGDPIIIKSDGFPTYHFANVVDDHFMNITHVLRGAEWQISTTKHLLMYNAFGWTPPQYAHLPLLLNSDGSKLSKRHGNANVEYYKSKGIFPQALVNYITLNGGGFEKPIGAKQKSYSMPELINIFNIKRINSHSTRLATNLLDECNRLEILKHIEDPIKCEQLVQQVKQLIKTTYPTEVDSLDIEDNHIRNVLHWAKDRITSIKQLVEGDLSFLWILPKIKDEHIGSEVLEKLVTVLETGEFDKTHLLDLLRDFSAENNLKFKTLMNLLRSTLSGMTEGPGVAEMMEILGRKGTIERIRRKNIKDLAKKKNDKI